jgi:hypothetical protein
MVAAWLAEFGGRANAEPPRIDWQAPSRFEDDPAGRRASLVRQFGGEPEEVSEEPS